MKTQKPQACEGCPYYDQPGPAASQGVYEDAKLIMITDYPSLDDCRDGRLFQDGTGRVFNKMLMDSKVRRTEVFLTSLVKCMPRKGEFLNQDAVKHCARFLEKDLERCKSDTVVLLGQHSFDRFIGSYSSLHPKYKPTSNIYNRKGCVEQRNGKKWIGTIHPREFMRMVSWRDEIIDHIVKAYLIANKPLPLPTIIERPTDAEILEAVNTIPKKFGSFANDVETHHMIDVEEDDYVGGDYEVDMGGISYGEHTALVCNPNQLHILGPLFSNEDLWRYEHNGMYDQYHFARILGHHILYRDFNINPYNHWMDGMLAAHYDRSYKRKQLKPDCLSRYTKLPYYDRKLELINRRLYNGMDCIATHQECITLRRRGQEQGWWDPFINIGMELLPVLEEQRIIGLKIDMNKAALFKRIFEVKMAKAREVATALARGMDPFNHHHLKQLLYEIWGLPKQYEKDAKTKKLKLSTNYEARKRIQAWINEKSERQEMYRHAGGLLLMVDYYSGEKKKSEYIDRIDPDQRIHPYYKAHGEKPFRISSKPNVQNIPTYDISDWGGARRGNKAAADPLGFPRKEFGSLRSLVTADDEDDLLLTVDFEQIQIWIYMQISGSKWLRSIYESQDYIYGVVYERLYNAPFFQPDKPRRKKFKAKTVSDQNIRRAKAVPLGFLFKRSPESVAEEYGWSKDEGYKLNSWWFKNNPELLQKYAALEFEVKQTGKVRQAFGVDMWFPEFKIPEIVNSPAQCNEAFIVMESMVLINREFKRRGWTRTRTMNSVHDAITMNIAGARSNPKHLVEVYEDIVKPICTRPIPQLGNLQFRTSAEVSYMWDWETQEYDTWKEAHFGPAPIIHTGASADYHT